MLTFLVLILILSVLVIAHEFGHFYIAKRNNVRVEEFGWGIPPRLWGKQIGETFYSINWLPFGGFVKLTGEDFEGVETSKLSDPRSFRSKTPRQRMAILIAGVVMNVLLAVLLYSGLFLITGFKTMTLPMFFDYKFKFGAVEKLNTVVGGFADNSPSKSAGIEVGESILEVENVPVYSSDDIKAVLASKNGEKVSVLLMDIRKMSRPVRSVKVEVKANEEGKVLLGVMLTPAFRLNYSGDNLTKFTAGLVHTYNMGAYSMNTLAELFSSAIATRDMTTVSESISGPVGISSAITSILSYSGSEVLIGLIDLTALLSISLAIMNILPFPALDGGRLFFVLIESLRGKKISEEIEGYIHRWGMLFLLGLLILITIKDVRNIF